MPNMSFPVCDLFDPVVHDGKLCFQMDMTVKMPSAKTVQGKGLTLIIDANSERSVANQIKREMKDDPKSLDLQEASVETNKFVEINIGTLAPFYAFGPGNYILTVVKQMSATDGFLSMSSKKRECEKEKFESCQRRVFQERIKKCGCTPQTLIPALQDQTQVEECLTFYFIFLFFFFRKLCAPLLVLTATVIITKILHLVLLPVKGSMLTFARSKTDFLDQNP